MSDEQKIAGIAASIVAAKLWERFPRDFRWLKTSVPVGKDTATTILVLQGQWWYQKGAEYGFEWRDIPIVEGGSDASSS